MYAGSGMVANARVNGAKLSKIQDSPPLVEVTAASMLMCSLYVIRIFDFEQRLGLMKLSAYL